jgi:uncharacterized protein
VSNLFVQGNPLATHVMGLRSSDTDAPLEDGTAVARLIDTVRLYSKTRWSSLHGETHWRRVAIAGHKLARQTRGADELLVLLFAVLHDSCRTHDADDARHGTRAAKLAEKLLGDGELLDADELDILSFALEEHDAGETSADPTVGCCWDADRLQLWRVGIQPDAYLLSTAAARRPEVIAWASYQQVAKYGWKRVLERYGYEAPEGFPRQLGRTFPDGGLTDFSHKHRFDTLPEGKAMRARRDARREELAASAKRVFVRFGDLPPDGVSRDGGFSWHRPEPGVCVFNAYLTREGIYVADPGEGEALIYDLLNFLEAKHRWPVYRVRGRRAGVGSAGEPTLAPPVTLTPISWEKVETLEYPPHMREAARFRALMGSSLPAKIALESTAY